MTARTTLQEQMTCIHQGCTARSAFPVYPGPSGVTGYDPPAGWIDFMLGQPFGKPNLGICEDHTSFSVEAEGLPALSVRAQREQHGVYYALHDGTRDLGKIAFPTNTFVMQPAPGHMNDRLMTAGRRVATRLGLSPDNGIVDDLMTRAAQPRIMRGGPHGHWGFWVVDVEYTTRDGVRETVLLHESQRTAWRSR